MYCAKTVCHSSVLRRILALVIALVLLSELIYGSVLPQARCDLPDCVTWVVDPDIVHVEEVSSPVGVLPDTIFVRNDVLYMVGSDGSERVLSKRLENWEVLYSFGKSDEFFLESGRGLYVSKDDVILVSTMNASDDTLWASWDGGNSFSSVKYTPAHFWKGEEDDEGNLYIGFYVYKNTREREQGPYVYRSDDQGHTWSIAVNGSGRSKHHVHHVEWDKWRKKLFVWTGDDVQAGWYYTPSTNSTVYLTDSRIDGSTPYGPGVTSIVATEHYVVVGGESKVIVAADGNLTPSYYIMKNEPSSQASWDGTLVDGVVYFAEVADSPGYGGITAFIPEYGACVPLFKVMESEGRYEGVWQVSCETKDGWVYALVKAGSTGLRKILRFRPLTKDNVLRLAETVSGNGEVIVEANVYAFKPTFVTLTPFEIANVSISFEGYSLVERIIRLEDWSDFSETNWKWDGSKIRASTVYDDEAPLNIRYLNVTTSEIGSIQERWNHQPYIYPSAVINSTIITFDIHKIVHAFSPETVVLTVAMEYDGLWMYASLKDYGMLNLRYLNNWNYMYCKHKLIDDRHGTKIYMNPQQNSEVSISVIGSYITNGTASNIFYPPANGTYMPRSIVINGTIYSTSRPVEISGPVTALDFSLPPDGCGSLKVKITGARAPKDTRIYFNFTPNPATPGSSLTLKGILLDNSSNPVTSAGVVVEYSTDNGATWNYIWNLTTEDDGVFSRTFSAPRTGRYLARVSYQGNFTYSPSSNNAYLTVRSTTYGEDPLVLIFFNFIPNPAASGTSVNLKGILLDGLGEPIASVAVTVEYSTNHGSTWHTIWTLTNDQYGMFSQTFEAPSRGAYLVQVIYHESIITSYFLTVHAA